MVCAKCGGKVGVKNTCSICGYVNKDGDLQVPDAKMLEKQSRLTDRSLRLTAFVWILVSITIISLLSSMQLIPTLKDSGTLGVVLFVILTAAHLLSLIILIGMLKMKKWALVTYIIITVINSLLSIINGNFIGPIFTWLLLYFILNKDYNSFE